MKMIDVVDENNVMLNEQLEYKTALAENRWYREVAIIIMSNTERLLLLKETSPKESNLWTIKTNYVEAGEGPIFAAIRVVNKEFKIKVSNADLKLLKVIKDANTNSFKYYYLLKGDYKLSDFENDESIKARFMSFDDIMEKIEMEEPVFEKFLERDFVELINAYKKRLIENYD